MWTFFPAEMVLSAILSMYSPTEVYHSALPPDLKLEAEIRALARGATDCGEQRSYSLQGVSLAEYRLPPEAKPREAYLLVQDGDLKHPPNQMLDPNDNIQIHLGGGIYINVKRWEGYTSWWDHTTRAAVQRALEEIESNLPSRCFE